MNESFSFCGKTNQNLQTVLLCNTTNILDLFDQKKVGKLPTFLYCFKCVISMRNDYCYLSHYFERTEDRCLFRDAYQFQSPKNFQSIIRTGKW